MKVEYSHDGKFAYFNGKRFTRDDKTLYYKHTLTPQSLHREVYEIFRGSIPKGFHVHHIDHNKLNNEIENLDLVKGGKHSQYHQANLTVDQVEAKRNNISKRALPAAVAWHKSEEGLKWHRENAQKLTKHLHVEKEYVCEQCGITFKSKKQGAVRFCSDKCNAKWRRDSGIDNVKRNCLYCGDSFSINKYSKTQFCTLTCMNYYRHEGARQME